MVRLNNTPLQLLILGTLFLFGCSKSGNWNNATNSLAKASTSIFTTDQSMSPFYGDSLLYANPASVTPYLISPVNNLGQGKYVGWPEGIVVDPATGTIDLQRSQPGARYNVGFVSSFTHDTAYRQVTLSGITYPYTLAVLDEGDSMLSPWYNASPAGQSFQELFQGESVSQIDIPGPNGQTAADQHVIFDQATGSINLLQSMKAGLFGSNPVDGAEKEIPIYYRLNDQSKGVVQSTSIIFHYYRSLSEVPAEFLNMVQPVPATPTFQEYALSNTTKPAPAPPSPPVASRPPHIVIVNTGH